MSVDALITTRDDTNSEGSIRIPGDGEWAYPLSYRDLSGLVGNTLTQLEAMGLNSTQLKACKSIFNRMIYGWFNALAENSITAWSKSAWVPLRTDDGEDTVCVAVEGGDRLTIRSSHVSGGGILAWTSTTDLPDLPVEIDGKKVNGWSLLAAALTTADPLTVVPDAAIESAPDTQPFASPGVVVRGRTVESRRIEIESQEHRDRFRMLSQPVAPSNDCRTCGGVGFLEIEGCPRSLCHGCGGGTKPE